MNKNFNLIKPLQKRVNEIIESFYPQQLLCAGDEKMIYGTFEKSFENFSKQSLRSGIRANETDFFKSSLVELEQIEDAVLQLEKEIDTEESNCIHFHAIFSIIHNTKQEANEWIKFFEDTEKHTPPKPRKIKSKLTYKWLIDEVKLYDFKRFLIKNELIDEVISFQNFKLIFTETSITELKEPIVWKNEVATQLIYLIKELQVADIIANKRKTFDYVQLYQCFIKNNGVRFTEKSKSLKNNIDIKVDSEFKALVKNIISALLN